MPNKRERDNLIKSFLCGGVAGEFNVFFGYPTDTIKVKLQTMPLPKPGEKPLYTGMYDCIKKTVKKEGFPSLFRGIQAPLIVGAPVYAVNFFAFGFCKKMLKTDDEEDLTMPQLLFSGSFSGVFTAFIMAPTERVKCLLQVQGGSKNPKYDGAIDCVRKLYAEGGMRSIGRGLTANLLRDVPGAGVYFMTYETIRQLLIPDDPTYHVKLLSTILAGGCAGIGYWLVGMPGDVLKTKHQTAPEGMYKNGLRDIYKELMRREGFAGFYRGLTPAVIRAFPVNAATFFGFELGDKVIDQLVELYYL